MPFQHRNSPVRANHHRPHHTTEAAEEQPNGLNHISPYSAAGRQQHILHLQSLHGNQAVQRMLGNKPAQPATNVVQREDDDGGFFGGIMNSVSDFAGGAADSATQWMGSAANTASEWMGNAQGTGVSSDFGGFDPTQLLNASDAQTAPDAGKDGPDSSSWDITKWLFDEDKGGLKGGIGDIGKLLDSIPGSKASTLFWDVAGFIPGASTASLIADTATLGMRGTQWLYNQYLDDDPDMANERSKQFWDSAKDVPADIVGAMLPPPFDKIFGGVQLGYDFYRASDKDRTFSKDFIWEMFRKTGEGYEVGDQTVQDKQKQAGVPSGMSQAEKDSREDLPDGRMRTRGPDGNGEYRYYRWDAASGQWIPA